MIFFNMIDKALPKPTRATIGSAGIDLRLSSIKEYKNGVYTLGLGCKVIMPEGTFGMLAVRSSTGANGLQLTNSVGIIDQDYQGELMMKCTFTHRGVDFPEIGDRIAQLIVLPYNYGFIAEIDDIGAVTVRGEGGYGSTNS